MSDERSPAHFGAEWGWVQCRAAVMREAVRLFVIGDDDKAQTLRHLAGSELVIQEKTMEGAPVEHCAPRCACRGVSS